MHEIIAWISCRRLITKISIDGLNASVIGPGVLLAMFCKFYRIGGQKEMEPGRGGPPGRNVAINGEQKPQITEAFRLPTVLYIASLQAEQMVINRRLRYRGVVCFHRVLSSIN